MLIFVNELYKSLLVLLVVVLLLLLSLNCLEMQTKCMPIKTLVEVSQHGVYHFSIELAVAAHVLTSPTRLFRNANDVYARYDTGRS